MRIKIFSLTQKKNLKSQTKREIFFVRCLSLLCLRSVFSLFAFLIKVKAFGARKREKKKKKKKKNQRAKKIICSLSLSLSLSLLNVFSNCARTPPTPTLTQRQHAHTRTYKMAKRTKSARKAAKKSASVRVYGRLFRFVGFWKSVLLAFIGEKDLKNDLSLSLSHSPNCLYCNRPILSLSLPEEGGDFYTTPNKTQHPHSLFDLI